MEAWLSAAIEYVGQWITFQLRHFDQPGCVIAIAKGSDVLHEAAFGLASLDRETRLTERHRFRIASHSKTFTAAGILKLKEAGRLRLDDTAGSFVAGLHPAIASVSIGQLLSNSAGLSRDGAEAGYFEGTRPFPVAADLLAELREAPPIEAGVRFKYSNHGFGLLGLIIEAVTHEPYAGWMMREVVTPAGLVETAPDISADACARLAAGHTGRLPLRDRVVIPGRNNTCALAPATGFASTASDVVRFFAQLSPNAVGSILSVESRREMTRPHWRDRDSALGRSYGLGVHCGETAGWEYFGHIGRFQGYVTRTAVFPANNCTVAVLTNAVDGPAALWVDGIAHILRRFHDGGPPTAHAAAWSGRWWNLYGAIDLVPIGPTIYAFSPADHPPFLEASEVSLTEPDQGRVTRAPGLGRFGEPVRRVRDDQGLVKGVRIGSFSFVTEAALQRQVDALREKRQYPDHAIPPAADVVEDRV